MSAKQAIKIICTGPESSGKSTLAAALAEALGTPWVPEFARSYLAYMGKAYQRLDLDCMEVGQWAWEDWYAQQMPASKPLICDTDWTVYAVWKKYVYGEVFHSPGAVMEGRYYLLCSPDMPWTPDPLREHPEERHLLFDHYRTLLDIFELPYWVLTGGEEERLEQALGIWAEITAHMPRQSGSDSL